MGWVAGAHIETFKKIPGIEVAAVCSRRALDPAGVAAQCGRPVKVFQDYRAMLDSGLVDVVDICTPHPYHADQAVAAGEAGKHLIIEKPIALNYEDALRVRKAIAKAKVRACVCFECRFSAHFRLVRSILDQGLIGKVHYGEVDYFHGIGPWYGQFPWNVKKDFGGSSLLTAGCHALDALLYFMNEPVLEVTSLETTSANPTFAPYEYKTAGATLIRFQSGHVAKVASVIDCMQPYYFHVHLVGSEGSILDDKWYSSKFPGLRKDRWSKLETSPIDSGDVHDHPYLPQFQAFFEAIRSGREMPHTSFEDGFQTHRVVFAADRSSALGRPVRLAEFAD